MLVPVRLNGALINGMLIDFASSLSMLSASTLAAHPVPPSVKPYTSCTPNIVDIGGSPHDVLGYVVAAVAVSDVEITHRIVVISKLAFPHLIGTDVFGPHRAVTVVSTPDALRLQLDRCSVCVDQRVPVTSQRDVVAAVVSVLSDTTLPTHAASRELVHLPPEVLNDPTSIVKPLPSWLDSTSCAVPPAVCATTGATRVLSVIGMSGGPVGICANCPIAAVSSVTPPQLCPHVSRKKA